MILNRSRIGRSMVALGLIVAVVLTACGNQPTPVSPTATTARPSPGASSAVVTVAPKPTMAAEPASAAPTLTATATQPPPAPTATSLPTTTVSLAVGDPPERTQYHLAATLDYARHHLAVTQTITYVNTTSETLDQLPLVVEANRQPDVFQLDGLRWVGRQEIADYTLDGARLRVALPQPLPPARSVAFSVFYQLALPARAAPLGYTARQTNLGDWYPFVPPYRAGHGWLMHEPGAVGEHLVYDVAGYEVELRLTGEQTGLVIAASAPAEVDGSQHRFRIHAARNFTLSASPEYVILYTVSGPAAVAAYVFPEHRAAGQAALDTTARALALYSELFVPYPYAGLAVVEVDFADGMEYDGLYFLGQEYFARYDGTPRNYLTTLAAHETAHQWWYGLVGNDQALDPWLDEALCTYSELLFYEALYPDLVDWWWSFRVNRFQPAGWVDSTIYEHQAFRPYVDAVYLRGAQFLQAVREQVGEEEFVSLLRAYVRQHMHSQATAEDLLRMIERSGGPGVQYGEYFQSVGRE